MIDSDYFWRRWKNVWAIRETFLWCLQFPISLARIVCTLVFNLWKFIEWYIYFCILFHEYILIYNKNLNATVKIVLRLSKYTNDNFWFLVASMFYFIFASDFNVKAKEETNTSLLRLLFNNLHGSFLTLTVFCLIGVITIL